ncbi:unnamed protein product [Acanthoscelides obtectus]|uniref:Uncharacterized protein n=1 Tax=Acanthoscelides obtectus TaxID=200917 RepID=A0A9P0MD07_ACAOB|nr:unnamed protein product [Acanthoscelides obtectus]CAK1633583.1 hypothetical protein AOBTE_LOCUS8237 [Acanthoscelides obtectus]
MLKQGVTTKKTKDQQSVVVKAGGKSYAELVRNLESQVLVEAIGVNIRIIKKAGKCDLLLMVDGESSAAGVLKEEIQKKVSEVEVYDIEETTTKEEIIEGSVKITGQKRAT